MAIDRVVTTFVVAGTVALLTSVCTAAPKGTMLEIGDQSSIELRVGDRASLEVSVHGSVGKQAQCETSDAAILTVLVPPLIITQPVNLTVLTGQSAAFSVTATGTEPLAYQWKKDGLDVSGATDSSYTITSADDPAYRKLIAPTGVELTARPHHRLALPLSRMLGPPNAAPFFGRPPRVSNPDRLILSAAPYGGWSDGNVKPFLTTH